MTKFEVSFDDLLAFNFFCEYDCYDKLYTIECAKIKDAMCADADKYVKMMKRGEFQKIIYYKTKINVTKILMFGCKSDISLYHTTRVDMIDLNISGDESKIRLAAIKNITGIDNVAYNSTKELKYVTFKNSEVVAIFITKKDPTEILD